MFGVEISKKKKILKGYICVELICPYLEDTLETQFEIKGCYIYFLNRLIYSPYCFRNQYNRNGCHRCPAPPPHITPPSLQSTPPPYKVPPPPFGPLRFPQRVFE